MKRLSSDMKALVALAVFVVICVIVFGGKEQSSDSGLELVPRRTTYSAKRYGLKALYETLHEVGYPVRRQLTALTSPPPDGVLFMVSPEKAPSRMEWEAVKQWVERGNLLVVAGHSVAPPSILDEDEPRFSGSAPVCPSFLSPGVKDFCLEEPDRIEEDHLGLAGLNGLVKPFG